MSSTRQQSYFSRVRAPNNNFLVFKFLLPVIYVFLSSTFIVESKTRKKNILNSEKSFEEDVGLRGDDKKIDYDYRIYKILLKELQVAEKVRRENPGVEADTRVFTSRIEIIKIIRSKNIQDLLKNPRSQEALNDKKRVEKFYKDTIEVGRKVLKYKKIPNVGKIYFLLGLTIYEFDEKNKNVPIYLKKSIDLASEKEIRHISASKLSDYYFNLGQFSLAKEFYILTIKLDSKSEWHLRHLNNLSWCYFKLTDFNRAIDTMSEVYRIGANSGQTQDYYYQQSLKKLPVFYLYARKPDIGLNFILKTHGAKAVEVEQYLMMVYDKGFFDSMSEYIERIDRELLPNYKKESVNLKLVIYNHITSQEYKKNYKFLTGLRTSIASIENSALLNPAAKDEFISSNKILLNEYLNQINSTGFNVKENRDDYLVSIDAIDIIKTMMVVNPVELSQYKLILAKLYKRSNQEEKALQMLWDDYKKLKEGNDKNREGYLVELLAVADLMKGKKTPFDLEKLYLDYLDKGTDRKIKIIVYLKLYDVYYLNRQKEKCLALIGRHKLDLPGESKDRASMYSKLIADATKNNDTDFFYLVKKQLDEDRTINDNKLLAAVKIGDNNINFGKINKEIMGNGSAGKYDIKSAKKLAELYRSGTLPRGNALVAGFNAALAYSSLGMIVDSNKIQADITSGLSTEEFDQYGDKISSLLQANFSQSENEDSIKLLRGLFTTYCKKNNQLKTLQMGGFLIEYYLSEEKFQSVKSLILEYNKCPLSSENKKKIAFMLFDYIDYNQVSSINALLDIMSLRNINTAKESDQLLESYFCHQINKEVQIDFNALNSSAMQLTNSIDRKIAAQSFFYQDLLRMISLLSKVSPYSNERINLKNFNAVVENNFSKFTSNLSLFASMNSGFSSINMLKISLELKTMNDFLNHWSHLEKRVDEKDPAPYVNQVTEALAPIKDKFLKLQARHKEEMSREVSCIYSPDFGTKISKVEYREAL